MFHGRVKTPWYAARELPAQKGLFVSGYERNDDASVVGIRGNS